MKQKQRKPHRGRDRIRHEKGEIVHARVASSFISPEQAELNLKELGKNSFDQLVANGRDLEP